MTKREGPPLEMKAKPCGCEERRGVGTVDHAP